MNYFKTPKESRIGSVYALSRKLNINESRLIYITENIEKYWRKGTTKIKPDGTKRFTNDAKQELKAIHEKINREILAKCDYPCFIHGSLKGKSSYTNAQQHLKPKILFCEDISGFFPNTSKEIVYGIWFDFFKFPKDVALILSELTTYQGALPQGWKCSSNLANLVFWNIETSLHSKLITKGFTYTRYVDDIAVSCKKTYIQSEKTEVISMIYGMVAKKGYQINRKKHEIKRRNERQEVTGLLINNRITINKEKRDKIKKKIYNLEQEFEYGCAITEAYKKKWNDTASSVGILKRMDPSLHKKLRSRLEKIKY